jgi:hypothetical protein
VLDVEVLKDGGADDADAVIGTGEILLDSRMI